MKKLKDVPQWRNAINVKNGRLDFAQWKKQDGVQMEMIFIDEAGINLWCKRTRGRAKQRERAVRVVGDVRGQNLTMTFAVSATNGIVHYDLFQGGMYGHRFCRFLEDAAAHLPREILGNFLFLIMLQHTNLSIKPIPIVHATRAIHTVSLLFKHTSYNRILNVDRSRLVAGFQSARTRLHSTHKKRIANCTPNCARHSEEI